MTSSPEGTLSFYDRLWEATLSVYDHGVSLESFNTRCNPLKEPVVSCLVFRQYGCRWRARRGALFASNTCTTYPGGSGISRVLTGLNGRKTKRPHPR